ASPRPGAHAPPASRRDAGLPSEGVLMLRTRRTAALAATATAALAAGGVLAAVAPAQAATPLPPHVFAPFVEMWTGDSPATLAQQSGATYQTWAFLQAATKGSCDVYWSGDTSLPVA